MVLDQLGFSPARQAFKVHQVGALHTACPALMLQMFLAIGIVARDTALYFKVIFLPISGGLAVGLVLSPAAMVVQIIFNLLWKCLVSVFFQWNRMG